MRRCLHKLTVQPDGMGRRVASLQRTIGQQNARETRGARAEAAVKAAAEAAALEQEELYGGGNVEVDGLHAAHGKQLLLLDPVFEFQMQMHSMLDTAATPLLLLHVRQRSQVALDEKGRDDMKTLAGIYLQLATLLSTLRMFGGSEADVAAASREKEAVILQMRGLLECARVHTSDLQRLLSLNAAYFLEYTPMVTALLSLLVEQLQRCTRVQEVLDAWPQLVQQCSPRFLHSLLHPSYDVSDDELIPAPPAAPRCSAEAEDADSGASGESDEESCRSDDSAAMRVQDLEEGVSAQRQQYQQRQQHRQQQQQQHQQQQQQQQQQDSRQHKFTYQHFVRSVSLLSAEQRKVLLAARSLMTRAGLAWQMQQEIVHGAIERMGAHVDVHTQHLQLSNGRRLVTTSSLSAVCCSYICR